MADDTPRDDEQAARGGSGRGDPGRRGDPGAEEAARRRGGRSG